jgi:hypothetical protein
MAPAAPRDLVAIVDSRHPQDEAAASNRYHPRAGFVLAPEDKRKVPLVAFTNQDVPCQSFALLAAEAYAAVLHWPSIMDRLDKSTEGGQQFVYSEVVLEYSRQCRLLGAISTPRGVQWGRFVGSRRRSELCRRRRDLVLSPASFCFAWPLRSPRRLAAVS